VRDWLLEPHKLLRDGLLVEPNKVTVGDFLDRWFEDVAKPKLRECTILAHESLIRVHVKPAVGDLRLVQLTPIHLQNLYAGCLKKGLSKKTVKNLHMILHHALGQAVKWGLVARNVADAVDVPTPARKPVEPLTQPQVTQLLEALEGDRLFPLYVVFLGCGLRRGEALALTWDCIDWGNKVIHVKKTIQSIRGKGLVVGEPKSESSRRVVAMPEYVQMVLWDHFKSKTTDSPYVFCTSNGTPFTPRNIIRHFKKVLERAGLPETTRIHDLRHTFVSFLLAQNQPPKDVQVIAGHADFSTTMNIYGHSMLGPLRDAAQKMAGA